MADSKFDLNKLKDNVGGLVGSLKSMISPGGSIPTADPDDALGLKITQATTLLKQLNDVLNGAFHDMQALRDSVKKQKAEAASAEKPAAEDKK